MGATRAELYRQVGGRMERAIREGFWLEAITLQESMVSDRLESLLESVYGKRMHRSLGPLLAAVRRLDGLTDDDRDLLARLGRWKDERNAALHMMVKFSDDHDTSWSERLAGCREAALAGRQLRNEVDRWVRRRRKPSM